MKLFTVVAIVVASAHAVQAGILPLHPRSDQLPLCVPPQAGSGVTGYPKSAVTTTRTGKNCTPYGDPAAQIVSDAQSPDGLQALVAACAGEIVSFKDNGGTDRMACLYVNPASTKAKPLPLVVWLHPSAFTSTITFPTTGWDLVRNTQQLNNQDPTVKGFSYVLPFGRNTVHQYPVPDNVALGWDNWQRTVNRSTADFNVDMFAIDKSISIAKSKVPVDPRRIFISGWSNGASMALEYALNTDGIAAAPVYSSPDPYRDSQDPCVSVPYPLFATPTLVIHNECDIIGTCTTGKYFYDDLRSRYPSLKQSLVIIDVATAAVTSRDDTAQCDPACQGVCAVTTGSAAHGRFPVSRNNDTLFAFMLNNPLPKSGTYGQPKLKHK